MILLELYEEAVEEDFLKPVDVDEVLKALTFTAAKTCTAS